MCLPKSIANLSNQLSILSLRDNHISGAIPGGLLKFVNLNILN